MALLSRLLVFVAMLENHYLYPVSDIFVPSLKYGTGVRCLSLCIIWLSLYVLWQFVRGSMPSLVSNCQ
jgi:hypothetical protein